VATGCVTRRASLLAIAGAALAACDRSRDRAAPSSPPAEPSPDWKMLDFPSTAGAPDGERALLFTPDGAREQPLLIALHGRGEFGRGLEAGARGWRDDYGLEAVHRRLRTPPLTAEHLGGFATAERLGRINASLAATPYRGLCVACPYTPNHRSLSEAAPFGRWMIDHLLPRVRAESGCRADRTATGIDGVSMGGRIALLVGLSNPQVFGAVGALQPALRPDEAEMVSRHARAAMAVAPVHLRLVSSEDDPFLEAVRAVSARLRQDAVPHDLVVTPGPHDYAWNRGPGSAEMLLWHERVLRGLPAP
jgi:iron(III)-salmochelin esterase